MKKKNVIRISSFNCIFLSQTEHSNVYWLLFAVDALFCNKDAIQVAQTVTDLMSALRTLQAVLIS